MLPVTGDQMPELRIDVEAIGRNTEVVAAMLRARGLDLVAVTKGCLGEPRVAAAMLAGEPWLWPTPAMPICAG